jgi:hypothetical protein
MTGGSAHLADVEVAEAAPVPQTQGGVDDPGHHEFGLPGSVSFRARSRFLIVETITLPSAVAPLRGGVCQGWSPVTGGREV